MISKKQAMERMLEFDAISFSTQKNVDLAIIMASSTGSQSVTFFYEKKTATKLKKLLRKKGFYLETVTFKSAPDQELITVVWDTDMLTSHERNKELE
jgi:aspartokinase